MHFPRIYIHRQAYYSCKKCCSNYTTFKHQKVIVDISIPYVHGVFTHNNFAIVLLYLCALSCQVLHKDHR